MTEKLIKPKLPPYVSFSAFVSFLNKLRDSHVPGKIDRTLLGSASGSLVSALFASLRSLGLVDDSQRPTKIMHSLVEASDEDRKVIYKELVEQTYAFLFNDPEFDLKKATTGQVADKFRQQDISGATIAKSIAFFLAMARDAGVAVSAHVKAPTVARATGKRSAAKASAKRETAQEDTGESVDTTGLDDLEVHRFEIPIPGKTSVKVIVPSDLDGDDWEMLQSVLVVYIKRWKGFKPAIGDGGAT